MALRTLGDVLSRSGTCVSLPDDSSVRALAKALVKNHVDSVIIVSSDDGRLCGIATARDVTKCIARNLDLDTTVVSLVMTANPITLPPTETPANALALMRQGKFRHIPVVDYSDHGNLQDGNNVNSHNDASVQRVIGIVDVLSLAYDAITRLQLSYSMIPSRRGYDFLRAARETIEKPTLRPMLHNSQFTTLAASATIAEACQLIVTKHTAAIVVVDANGIIDGIFTCTDVVKRVVVAKKDPAVSRVADVMTVNPDCASPDFTILECLQRMQACGFRHLPVVEDQTRAVVGLVDVLQLASDALLDLNKSSTPLPGASRLTGGSQSSSRASSFNVIGSSAKPSDASHSSASSRGSNANASRPGLGRNIASFFGSLFSNSYAQRDPRDSVASRDGRGFGGSPRSPRSAAAGAAATVAADGGGNMSVSQTIPDMTAVQSLSYSNSQTRSFSTNSQVGSLNHHHHSEPRSPTRRHYGYLPANSRGRSRHTRADVPLASFKFKDINGNYRRIKVPMVLERGDYDQFVLDVRRRFYSSPTSASAVSPSTGGAITINYIDEDGDEVLIAHDDDLASCFEDMSQDRGRTIILKVRDDSASSKLQSPVSSVPSSAVGSPARMSVSSEQQDQQQQEAQQQVPKLDDGSMARLKPSVEPPPLEEPLPERDSHRPGGVYRTNSRLKMHTPSTRKASEGHHMMLDKRIDEAIVLFSEALQLDADNARAMGERGAAHLLNGATSEAESDYRAALAMIDKGKGGSRGDMTYQMCVVGLVETLIDQHRYEDAVETAADMDPRWGNTGCVDALRDELDVACVAANDALLNKNSATADVNYADAMTCFNHALRVEAAYLSVMAQQTSGGPDGDGGNMARVSLRLGRAKCYAQLGDYDMALEDYDAAASLDPESVSAHKGRGKCLLELEKLQAALEAYERASGLDPGDEQVKSEIITIKGLLPDPTETKKAEIAKLGALLGGMNLPSKKLNK